MIQNVNTKHNWHIKACKELLESIAQYLREISVVFDVKNFSSE